MTHPNQADFLHLHASDNVAVSVADLEKGDTVTVGNRKITLADDIPFGHKFALYAVSRGEAVIKYEEQIGLAVVDIAEGSHVHVHNVASIRG